MDPKPKPWSLGAANQREARQLLGDRSRTYVWQLAKEGKIRAMKDGPGGRPKYCRLSIQQFLASKEA